MFLNLVLHSKNYDVLVRNFMFDVIALSEL